MSLADGRQLTKNLYDGRDCVDEGFEATESELEWTLLLDYYYFKQKRVLLFMMAEYENGGC